eukprot:181486-Pyramimonas_sp.AAC.1
MARHGRRALQGKAVTTVRGTDADDANVQRRIRSWSNRRVRQHWRLASAETEMLVRRLGWHRSWALSPTNHAQELCLLFGTLDLDEGGKPMIGRRVVPSKASPWLLRMQADFRRASELLDEGGVCAHLALYPGGLADKSIASSGSERTSLKYGLGSSR